MDTDKLAFWGIALKPGEPADLDLQDGETLHVTMASFGVDLADEKGRSVVTATVDSGQKHGLVVLNAGKTESRVMDVSFIGEESITFEVSGKDVVHLVGNFSFENDVSDSDESDEEGEGLIGVYDDDDEIDSDSDEEDDAPEPRLLMNCDPPVITDVTEEEDKNDKAVVVKKKNKDKKEKLPNGKHKAEPKVKAEAAATKGQKKADPKHAKKHITFKKAEESESEEEEESEPAMKVETIAAKKSAAEDEDSDEDSDDKDAAKPSSKVLMQSADSDDDDDEVTEVKPEDAKTTPKSAKNKRSRKRKSNATPEEPTSPTSKKSKISQRPGTPAAVKSGQRAVKVESAGKNSAKKANKQIHANGGPAAGPSTAAQDKPKIASDDPGSSSKSGKKRRRKSKKGGDNSA